MEEFCIALMTVKGVGWVGNIHSSLIYLLALQVRSILTSIIYLSDFAFIDS